MRICDCTVVEATADDAKDIVAMVSNHAERGAMLHRTMYDVVDRIQDYQVVKLGYETIGCASLKTFWTGKIVIGEIRSLSVITEWHKNGVGKALVEWCLSKANVLGLKQVFALTLVPGFFQKCGFDILNKANLPNARIWTECVNCQKYQRGCDETLVSINLGGRYDIPV